MRTARYLPNYSVDDYREWEGDWELWQGIPIAMTPSPFGRHQYIASNLLRLLADSIEVEQCEAVVLPETDWVIDRNTVLRPDLSVVCGDIPETQIVEPPALIAEVLSPSTQARDLGDKKELYFAAGLRNYLAVNPDSLEVQFSGHSGELRPVESANLDITLCDDCEVSLDLRKIGGLLNR